MYITYECQSLMTEMYLYMSSICPNIDIEYLLYTTCTVHRSRAELPLSRNNSKCIQIVTSEVRQVFQGKVIKKSRRWLQFYTVTFLTLYNPDLDVRQIDQLSIRIWTGHPNYCFHLYTQCPSSHPILFLKAIYLPSLYP